MPDRFDDVSRGRTAAQLPIPDPEAQAQSARLTDRIRQEIADGNARIPFDRFMDLALYAPGLGYYVAGARKFGEAGDFITAPEVSPLFAQCLARQCRDVLQALPAGGVLEFGAGSGIFAVDLLQELERLGGLPERYLILEPSPELRQRQQQTIAARAPQLLGRVEWVDRMREGGFCGVVIANEVLDAMPVHLFRRAGQTLQEAFVAWNHGRFALQWDRPESAGLEQAVLAIEERVGPFAEGYASEINLRAAPWLRLLSDGIEAGLVLLIDYGYPRAEYYHPQRDRGTLMCHYRHRAHPDPLRLVGIQDVTAHVDFTALAEAGQAAGLSLQGFATQAHFLIGCGLEQLLADSDPDQVAAHMELMQAVKRLTLPSEMGERFKVLALTRQWSEPLRGFSLRDLRDRLS